MGEAPSLAGGDHATVEASIQETFVGACGGPSGTPTTGTDARLERKAEFVPTTVTEYDCPPSRPVIVQASASGTVTGVTHCWPPGRAVAT